MACIRFELRRFNLAATRSTSASGQPTTSFTVLSAQVAQRISPHKNAKTNTKAQSLTDERKVNKGRRKD